MYIFVWQLTVNVDAHDPAVLEIDNNDSDSDTSLPKYELTLKDDEGNLNSLYDVIFNDVCL